MGPFLRRETAQLLFEKLTRDLARLETWPNDADIAFNFFLAADAILDWLCNPLEFPDHSEVEG